MAYPIIDLHCDLLFYLDAVNGRTANDPASRCSIPLLRQGNVMLQTMAVFTQTAPDSVQRGMHQIELYEKLPIHYPGDFVRYTEESNSPSSIAILIAIENASGFSAEGEPLSVGIKRFHHLVNNIVKPLYISLTWNTENRFGGGAHTHIGLKEDGKRLLEELNERKIAVDLSHTSDHLAYDIIDYIEGHSLNIPLMASHSNAREIISAPRNLSDELAKEIFRRGGIVGFNLCKQFIGTEEEFLAKQIGHWLELGGENHIAFGADFFNENDLPPHFRKPGEEFFSSYQNSSCYGTLLDFLQKELRLSSALLEKLAYKNAEKFISLR